MANYTDAQNRAYGAGVGYATAKKGERVTVAEENKTSFLAGIAKVRGKKAAAPTPKQQFSVADKIEHYSGRVDNPKLSERQRKFAARRLRELANK